MLGPWHPDVPLSMSDLAIDYANLRKYAQAEALFSQALEMSNRVSGPEHPPLLKHLFCSAVPGGAAAQDGLERCGHDGSGD